MLQKSLPWEFMQGWISTFSFFFFQAEDGIRDHCVTGVQTCALPISQRVDTRRRPVRGRDQDLRRRNFRRGSKDRCPDRRSEERRVGKECRSRWSQEQ